MSNADYEVRSAGAISPSAMLSVPMGQATFDINLTNYTANDSTGPAVGDGLLIGSEILRVNAVNMPVLTVSRGCADTVPARHALGSKVWFVTRGGGADTREYIGTEVIGVKLLMKSTSSTMAIASAPPRRLAFNQRFARPYPPGNVSVNSTPFYSEFALSIADPTLTLYWSHRDRITQGDTLHGHEVGDIGPEVGTTYVLRVFTEDGTLVRIIDGIEGNTASYDIFQAIDDLTLTPGSALALPGYLTLHSVREGFESWQGYRIDFTASASALTAGWGQSWGFAWGGNA